tara:strand:+ start:1696 stop:1797 length:102 start_codon:yes stop_codon:yes gene_type:complete
MKIGQERGGGKKRRRPHRCPKRKISMFLNDDDK